MIEKENYAARIASASRVELIVINFDLIMDYLREAKENSENGHSFVFNIGKSREFLREMKLALNMDYEISKEYHAAYTDIDRLIAGYLFSKSDETYEKIVDILTEFRDAWANVDDDDTSPVMSNTEQMYAGLTYGKDGKLTEYVDICSDRGFKA